MQTGGFQINMNGIGNTPGVQMGMGIEGPKVGSTANSNFNMEQMINPSSNQGGSNNNINFQGGNINQGNFGNQGGFSNLNNTDNIGSTNNTNTMVNNNMVNMNQGGNFNNQSGLNSNQNQSYGGQGSFNNNMGNQAGFNSVNNFSTQAINNQAGFNNLNNQNTNNQFNNQNTFGNQGSFGNQNIGVNQGTNQGNIGNMGTNINQGMNINRGLNQGNMGGGVNTGLNRGAWVQQSNTNTFCQFNPALNNPFEWTTIPLFSNDPNSIHLPSPTQLTPNESFISMKNFAAMVMYLQPQELTLVSPISQRNFTQMQALGALKMLPQVLASKGFMDKVDFRIVYAEYMRMVETGQF
jgi:hypothetical protein